MELRGENPRDESFTSSASPPVLGFIHTLTKSAPAPARFLHQRLGEDVHGYPSLMHENPSTHSQGHQYPKSSPSKAMLAHPGGKNTAWASAPDNSWTSAAPPASPILLVWDCTGMDAAAPHSTASLWPHSGTVWAQPCTRHSPKILPHSSGSPSAAATPSTEPALPATGLGSAF